MAILGKFEVNVIVDDKEAREYDDDELLAVAEPGAPPTVTRYVEAVSKALFSFRICIESGYNIGRENSFVVRVLVDGQNAISQFLNLDVKRSRRSSKRRLRSRILHVLTHARSADRNATCLEKLQFSDIQLCETEITNDPALVAKYCKLGTFRIELWRTIKHGPGNPSWLPRKSIEGLIPEKALKGKMLDVTTSFIPDPSVQRGKTFDCDYLDADPLAVFNFKYHTRRGLQSLDIIPRSPSPVPLEDKPIDELTREEMAEIIKRQREREQSRIKQEAQVKQEPHKGLSVKRERDATPREGAPHKFSKGPRGEKVYHLDDD